MRTLELKDICGYLPHGLIVYKKNTGEIFPVFGIEINRREYHSYDWWNMDNFKPILRPLSDLYRTITHNGKEIIPIIECAKIALPDFEFIPAGELCYWQSKHRGLIQFYMERGAFTVNFVDDLGYIMVNQIPLFDYLNELKIDYRGLVEAGLAIDANTLDINPYK
jgi:hypothetical protein